MKRIMAVKRYRVFSGLLLAGAFALALTGCELFEDNPVNDESEIQPIPENTDFDKPETSQDEIPVGEVNAEANQTGAEGQNTEEIDQSGTAGQTSCDGVDGEANKGQLDDALIQNLIKTLSEADPGLLAGSCLFLKFAKNEVSNEDQAKIINELEMKFCPGDNAPNPNPDLIPSPPSVLLSPGQCKRQIMGPFTPGFTPAVLKKMAYEQCGSLGGNLKSITIGRVNEQGLSQQAQYLCCAKKQPPKPTGPSASKKEVCGQMLTTWLKTLPKEDHFYTKPAFYICLEVGREEAMCEIIKKELPHRPSDFGKMVFQQHCADKPQPVEPPTDPCASIFENLKNLPPGNESFAKYHFTICKNPGSIIPICDMVMRELDRNPTQYGKELVLKYCKNVPMPPVPDSPDFSRARIESCEKQMRIWQETLPEADLYYTKPAFIFCLEEEEEAMCEMIKKELPGRPSDFGKAIFEKHCLDQPQPVEPPADTCASIFENMKNLPSGNSGFVKYHFTMCKQPGREESVCKLVLRELDRNPTQYGQALALQYCADVTLPPPPPEPDRPSPARMDSCETLMKSWEESLTLENDFACIKPAFVLCMGKDEDRMCDLIEKQLEKFPSDFGQAVHQENCVEEDAVPAPAQADTAAGCMLAARLWSVYYHLMTGAPNYGIIKDDAYFKCSQMMYTLVEPEPLCIDLEYALPTVPPDSKEYATIQEAMDKAACK